MGITRVTWNSASKIIKEAHSNHTILLNLVELGDQFRYYQGEPEVLMKSLIGNEYNEYSCIDWHGNNGVIKLDFREEVPEEMKGRYDILTNFGFTEHVTDQYMAWKNIDSLLKVGGIAICELPGEATFPNHREFPYYTTEFFISLCEKQDYDIIEVRYQNHDYPLRGQVCFCAFRKGTNIFVDRVEFERIEAKLGRNDS